MDREIAVIVGVGAGLGWALVQRFAAAGMQVVAAARRADKLHALVQPGQQTQIRVETCDATKPADVTRLFDTVASEVGTPRVAVFNAGTYERGGILELTPESFERCWRIGCMGGFLVGQAAARLMVPAGAGTILFTGATASLRGSAGFANLAVPKFGLRALAQSMARELGPKGIHVAHVIIDGQIEAERNRELAQQRGPDSLLPPAAIAEAYLQLHQQPRGAWTHELDLRPWVEKF
ncbi:MAG TPA: SDR family NAD(P)-dependent oxidoreductase [Burkholderiaceae bacterium]|nr:SDR family NAD(P)-dependent oxidoreductase [Burkholderiaceae bacterium]